MNKKLLVVAMAVFAGLSQVQVKETKVGYTFFESVVSVMPDMEGVNASLTTYRKQFSTQVTNKQNEIQRKINELQQLAQNPNASQLVLRERENEIVSLRDALEKFSLQADQAILTKQTELMNPVYKKVQDAIEEVRKEKGYTLVINAKATSGASNVVLAADKAYDLTAAVFDKLGIEP